MKIISFFEFNRNLNLDPIKFSLTQREEGANWPLDKVQLLELWYRRFLYLVSLYPEKVIVPSKEIDIFWHTHILDTQKYMADCEALFGQYFHHFPYFGMRGEKDRNNLEDAFQETDKLFFQHFGESPLSTKIADCGSLCNEPTPNWEGNNLYPNKRPTLAGIETTI